MNTNDTLYDMKEENMNNSIWENDQDETPITGVDPAFQKNLLRAKRRLYHSILFAPELGTSLVHDPRLLQTYLRKLGKLYQLALQARTRPVEDIQLIIFPKVTRSSIKEVVNWITSYFSANKMPDTIPYSNCIKQNLHTYQFVQKIVPS